MKANKRVTVIINTCDAYQDVLQLFLCAFNDYWKSCEFPIIINTESVKHDFHDDRIQVFNYPQYDGTDHWGDRLRTALASVTSDFVLMLYDDFILEDCVDAHGIEEGIELLSNEPDAAAAYLIKTGLPTSCKRTATFARVEDRSDFILNSAPAIWRKDTLLSYIGKYDNPWAWEVFGSYRTWNRNSSFYTINLTVKDIYPYNHDKGGAIYRGKWVKEVVIQKFKKYNLSIDPAVRGFINMAELAPRSLRWKINFMLAGIHMVGIKAFYFIIKYLMLKIQSR